MIKKVLKKLQQKLNIFLKPLYFSIHAFQVQCNICEWKDSKLKSDSWHLYVICPRCGSQVRHRLFWAAVTYQVQDLKNLFKNKRVLHFAPDECLTSLISKQCESYETADFLEEGYNYQKIDLNIDMSNMKEIGNETFDCVLAFDVLEHIPNHLDAIEETNRILKNGGYCIFTIPQKDNLLITMEDLTITNPKERERRFGQWDHRRIYGDDFKDILIKKGFAVTIVDESSFNQDLIRKNVLSPPVLSTNPFATNFRKVYFGRKIM